MKLGVVIVTFNRLKLLHECLEACLNQSYPFQEIFIVNNASTDGTAEYLKEINNPKVKVFTSQKNLGGSYGFYVGVKHYEKTKLDYVVLIDDDAILDKNYNQFIVKYMSDNLGISGYSGVVKTDGKIQFEHRRHLKNPNVFKETNSSIEEYHKKYFDYELSTFCGLFIPVKLIKKIKYPAKDFFIWFDDTEYSLRLLKYGKIRNINTAILNHKTTILLNKGHTWKSYYSLRNKIIILKKYFSKFQLIKYYFLLLVKSIMAKIIYFISQDVYYKLLSKMYIDAFYDGKNGKLGKNEKYTFNLKMEKRKKKI